MLGTKFGIEIEFTGITREKAAKIAADFLHGTYSEGGTYYDTKKVTPTDGRVWKFMYDGSISCQRKERGRTESAGREFSVELVSPILSYREDIETLQELVRQLRHAGAFTNSSCGIHIHLDGADHTPRSIRNFVNIIASKNDLFYKALRIAPQRMSYCKNMDSILVDKMNRKKPTTMRQIEDIWYEGYSESRGTHYHHSRYHFLNLHSFFTGNHTVELRGFNSELHAGKVRSYIVLALALNNQALTQKCASAKKPQIENEKFAMRTYLNRILTVVEDALVDGIAEPPEPPAQEWLNQVLTALAELDISDTYSLLNLTYNLLNSNYNLLNTTNDLVNDTHNLLNARTGILLNHWHPVETATAPELVSRRASITFAGITAGSNVVIGTITYTFVSALGSPAANAVQVLIQGTLRGTVQKLSEAIRGNQDPSNIAYGLGVTENPICTAYWTSQRFSIGDTTVAPGESLFLLEKAEDVISPLTLTSTATTIINPFTRAAYVRYVMSGNTSGAGGTNSVRGPLHTILPINSVVIGGQGGQLTPTIYDCHLITLCRQSDTSEKELDLYISNDEVTFTKISRSNPIGADSTTESQHVHIEMRQSRIPAGYGMYVRLGSNGTSSTSYTDLKFTYHLYPVTF